jgi:hypothetical protein
MLTLLSMCLFPQNNELCQHMLYEGMGYPTISMDKEIAGFLQPLGSMPL